MTGQQPEITVPRYIVAKLLDLYISCWDYDETWYLANYPDVQDAVNRRQFPSGWMHFRTVGYFEGRFGATPSVDADWYIATYPDVARAILSGEVENVLDHFVKFGYFEGRLP